MKIVQRYDSVMLKALFDENGFLIDTPIVARVGMQEYVLPDGTIQREFRPRGEVFDWESLASYQGKPITLGHVTVTTKNAKKVTVGNCSGPAFAEELEGVVRCPITILDEKAIESATSGKTKELSVGYSVIEVHEPGFGSNKTGEYILKRDITDDYVIPEDWVEFDVIQTQIRVNHLALVRKGRAGVAKLNLDSSEELPYHDDDLTEKEDSIIMIKFKIDGDKEFDIPKEVADHIEVIKSNASELEVKQDALEAERDALKAECEELKAKVDGIPAQIEEAVEKAKADAEALAALVKVAEEAGVKCDGLDQKGIKVAYVKAVIGSEISEKSDAYIDAAFEIASNSDKMAANRIAVKGDALNSEAKDVKPLNPNARLNKVQ